MITRKELSQVLDDLYKPNLFSDYCPNGLQVEGSADIYKIGVAVTATYETIQKAILNQCQALIVHHGLFWTRDPYPILGTKKEKLSLLLKNEISLFSYHLPMDAQSEIGNNWKAAKDLGLTDLNPFGIIEKIAVGVRGNVATQGRKDFQKRLEEYYGHAAQVAFGGDEFIDSVAIVSGGAYKLLQEAAQSSISAFVTGSYDLPAWSQAYEEEVNFFALGHHATERIGPLSLTDRLQNLHGIPSFFIEENNPF